MAYDSVHIKSNMSLIFGVRKHIRFITKEVRFSKKDMRLQKKRHGSDKTHEHVQFWKRHCIKSIPIAKSVQLQVCSDYRMVYWDSIWNPYPTLGFPVLKISFHILEIPESVLIELLMNASHHSAQCITKDDRGHSKLKHCHISTELR